MKNLVFAALSFMCAIVSAGSAHADLILRLAQTTPPGGADLPLNDPSAGIFSIFLSSTVPNQGLSGINFRLSLSSASGLGGTLASGTLNLPISGGSWSNPDGWMAGSFPSTSAVFNSAVNTGSLSIGTSEQLLATVTVSTVGAVANTYTASISEFEAGDASFNSLGLSTALSTLNLQYTAAPEPSSIALVGLACIGTAWKYRRRKRT